MRYARVVAGAPLIVAAAALPASADAVFLRDAGVLSGRVLSRTPTSVEIEIAAGTVTIPMDRIERIEEGFTILDEYDERAAALAPRDHKGWLDLARWASAHGLASQARRAYEHVLTVAPDDAEANRAVGRVELDGRWVSEAESYRVRGYVRFENTWVTPEERQRILNERAEREQMERILVASDERVREAEAQAREAEARAAEAEAAASAHGQVEGIPLWWVWGPGPVVWPSGPVVGSRCPPRTRTCW